MLKKLIPIFDNLSEANCKHCTHLDDYVFPEDLQYALEFLFQYQANKATYNSYRRELEKLLQWSSLIAEKSLPELKRQDIEDFIEFCQHPAKSWIATQKFNRYLVKNGERVPNENWRPFVVTLTKELTSTGKKPSIDDYKLSEKALAATFSILGSFLNYLVQVNYCKLNPLTQIRQKKKYFRRQQAARVVRRLSELQWTYVIETVEMLAEKEKQHERTLFIISSLYGMYLRISELACKDNWQPTMGDFFRDNDNLWWFKTVGKGNKERDISISDSMLKALKRYRNYLSLPPLPTIGETTPLLLKENSKQPLTSTRQIRDIVQFAFDQTIARLETDGFADEATQLQAATVHWLRHTGISDDVKIRPREHVRDDAGHSSSAITDQYIDIEKRQRHSSAKNKSINPEE